MTYTVTFQGLSNFLAPTLLMYCILIVLKPTRRVVIDVLYLSLEVIMAPTETKAPKRSSHCRTGPNRTLAMGLYFYSAHFIEK